MTRSFFVFTTALLARGTLLTMLILTLTVSAFADPTPAQLADRLQQRYRELTSLRFSFSQQTSGQMTGRPKTGAGDGVLFNDGGRTLMRWNYETPDRQVVISDGQTVSMYFEQLKQMIIAPADNAQADLLLSFFTGARNLDETFTVLPVQADAVSGNSAALYGMLLVPREPNPQLRQVQLFVDDEFLIRRLELLDQFDTKTVIDFRDIRVNPFSATDTGEIGQTFTFEPPPGTEIIRQ